MSYKSLLECMNTNGCKLITTEQEYEEIKKNKNVFKVDYTASCGHSHKVFANIFKSRGTGIKCPSCVTKINSKKKQERSRKENGQAILTKMEDDTIIYLQEIINNKFRIRKTWEGCLYDLAIQPIECHEDKWLPIQVKTTSKPLLDYGFQCNNRYIDCLIFCFCFSDKKMWLIPGNDIKTKCKIAIGLKKSKYDLNSVTKENIHDVLLRFYSSNILFSFEQLDVPISLQQQTEREYRKFMESKCSFLPFEYPERNCLVFDFIINGYKVQEKVGTVRKNRDKSIIFSIHKNNGTVDKVRKFQCYTIGDNHFYWLQFPDKKHFYILPESVLINDGIINNGLLEKYKKNLIVSFKDMKNIKYKEYLFHYDALDIFKIKGLFGLGV